MEKGYLPDVKIILLVLFGRTAIFRGEVGHERLPTRQAIASGRQELVGLGRQTGIRRHFSAFPFDRPKSSKGYPYLSNLH